MLARYKAALKKSGGEDTDSEGREKMNVIIQTQPLRLEKSENGIMLLDLWNWGGEYLELTNPAKYQ